MMQETLFVLYNVLVAILLIALYFILRRTTVQAKFVITFTENPAVPPISLTTTSFTDTVGVPETGSLGPTGGNGGPYTVTVDPTTPLPPGVTLDAQGNISGTPTTAGTFSVNVTVADSQG